MENNHSLAWFNSIMSDNTLYKANQRFSRSLHLKAVNEVSKLEASQPDIQSYIIKESMSLGLSDINCV